MNTPRIRLPASLTAAREVPFGAAGFNPSVLIVPIDDSPDMERTIAIAVAIGKHRDADVHLLSIVPPRVSHLNPDGAPAWFEPGVEPSFTARLRASKQSADRNGVRAHTVTLRGEATKVIPAYAQLKMASLIVVGSNYGTSRIWRNTSLARRLGRVAPVPVLVVPPAGPSSSRTAETPLRHIVAAIDFTVASAMALRAALELSRRHGARVTMVHAMEGGPGHMVFSGGEALQVVRNLPVQTQHIAERLRRKIGVLSGANVEPRVVTGLPHHAILEAASATHADLIVMGVSPRTRLHEAVFGSTLRTVLRRAKRPVLMIPVASGTHDWLDELGEASLERRV